MHHLVNGAAVFPVNVSLFFLDDYLNVIVLGNGNVHKEAAPLGHSGLYGL